jgi:hypothetical protein
MFSIAIPTQSYKFLHSAMTVLLHSVQPFNAVLSIVVMSVIKLRIITDIKIPILMHHYAGYLNAKCHNIECRNTEYS